MNVYDYLQALEDEPKYFIRGGLASCYFGECGDQCSDWCEHLRNCDKWAEQYPKTATKVIELWQNKHNCGYHCPCHPPFYCYVGV